MSNKPLQSEERLVQVETEVVGLKKSFDALGVEVKAAISVFQASQRPQYQLWLMVGSFVLAAGGGLWALAIAPMRQGQDSTSSQVRSNTEHIARLSAMFEEVEAQFKMSGHIANLRHEEDERLIRIVSDYAQGRGLNIPPRTVHPSIDKYGRQP